MAVKAERKPVAITDTCRIDWLAQHCVGFASYGKGSSKFDLVINPAASVDAEERAAFRGELDHLLKGGK